MGEIEFDRPLENETAKQKIPKKKLIEKPIHPWERKKALEAKMAKMVKNF